MIKIIMFFNQKREEQQIAATTKYIQDKENNKGEGHKTKPCKN